MKRRKMAGFGFEEVAIHIGRKASTVIFEQEHLGFMITIVYCELFLLLFVHFFQCSVFPIYAEMFKMLTCVIL